jgi:NAD(P)-dependent dehydrogenase (short-subunit alcohol dehydrogenase family)
VARAIWELRCARLWLKWGPRHVLDISGDRADACARQIRERFGGGASAVVADITSEAEVAQSIRQDHLSRAPGYFINNAAYSPRDLPPDGLPLVQQSLAQWEAQLAVILNGTFLMSPRAPLPADVAAAGRVNDKLHLWSRWTRSESI